MTNHSNRRTFAKLLAPLVVFGLVAAACGSDDDSSGSSADTTDASDTTDAASTGTDAPAADGPTIRLRGQDFSEAITIAEVYGQYLQAKGYDVEIQTPAGFRTEAIDGISNGDLDLIVDYIGGAQAALAPDAAVECRPRRDRGGHRTRVRGDRRNAARLLPRRRRRRVRRSR